LLLIALATAGVVVLRRAWLVRRATGAAAFPQAALAGGALLVPAAVVLVAGGPDRGWYIGMTMAHSYALTTHAAQGDTYDAARPIATDASSSKSIYVGVTRAEHDIRLYVVFQSACTCARPSPSSGDTWR